MLEPMSSAGTVGLFVFLLDAIVVKASAVVLVAVVVCASLRRASASVRHGVWASAFVLLLILPWAPSLPLWSSGTGPRHAEGTLTQRASAVPPPSAEGSPVGSVLRSRGGDGVGSGRDSEGRRGAWGRDVDEAPVVIGYTPLQSWVVGLWSAGVLLGLVRLVSGAGHGWRLRRGARCAPGWMVARAASMAREVGLARTPRVLVSEGVDGPGTLGALSPVILVPGDIGDWSPDAVDAALLHELSHLQRRDYVMHLLAGVVRALYWINPAVHYAERRLDRERERACDDGVVHRAGDPVGYAEVLLGFALRSRSPLPVLPLATRSSLAERVRSLLDPGQARSPLGRRGRVMIALASVSLLVTLGAVDLFGIGPSGIQEAMEELADNDPATRQRGAWRLGEAEDGDRVPSLVQALRDPDPGVRVTAAWALGEIKDPSALPPLVELLSDPDALVREMAVLALGEIEDDEALPALAQVSDAEVDARARQWAEAQIRRRSGTPEVFAGRFQGIEAGSVDLEGSLRALERGTPDERARAAEALGALGSVHAVDALLRALADPEPTVRAHVVWALDEINPSRAERVPAR